MTTETQHPDYFAYGKAPGSSSDRCVCGGIRYWHATPEGGGCEDCPCEKFELADES
jgi:hypothetical protein